MSAVGTSALTPAQRAALVEAFAQIVVDNLVARFGLEPLRAGEAPPPQNAPSMVIAGSTGGPPSAEAHVPPEVPR
jgi:hypothetical protein